MSGRQAGALVRRWGAVAVGVTAVVGTGVLPAAAAGPLTCGSVVTESVSLTADMTCSSGDALVVGADNIVIDLKGHKITGPWPAASTAGIRVYQHSGVEIRNGRIADFGNGVRLDTNSGNRVWNITVTGSWRAVDIANSSNNLIEKNRFSGTELDTVRLGGVSSGNVIRQNVLTDNHWGISVADDSTGTLVSRNSISGSVDFGIAVFTSQSGTVVSQNVVSGSVYDGMRIMSAGTQVIQNTATGNGDDGVDVTGAGSTLRANTATYNGDLGIEASVPVTDGGGNKAYGNGNALQCVGVACAGP